MSTFPAERTAIVTGAVSERGIGRATANYLAAQGWNVGIIDLDADAAQQTASEIDGDSVVYAGDLTKEGAPDALVKLSAAWLIEHAGIARGFSLPGSRAAVSSKHTLALTNRGGATAEQIAELARYVQGRVLAEFGILLHPEPVVVGTTV